MLHSELIDCQALSTRSLNSCAGCCGESESSDVECRDFEKAIVVGNGADNADGLVFVGLLCLFGRDFAGDSGNGHGRAVDAGHEQAAKDNFVEVGVGAA